MKPSLLARYKRQKELHNIKLIISKNIEENSINENNIQELIKICVEYAPNLQPEDVIEHISKYLPKYSEIIEKYKILI